MKQFFVLAILLLMVSNTYAQKLFTRSAKVQFNSATSMEKIEAKHSSGSCVLDPVTGKMEWKVLIKGFKFEKALMEEHFNENYLESTKFPSAGFKGEMVNLSAVNFAQNGTYKVNVKGQMTIHGVVRDIETTGNVIVTGGKVRLAAAFTVKCADYGISIPSVVAGNIAEQITVQVDADLTPLKQ